MLAATSMRTMLACKTLELVTAHHLDNQSCCHAWSKDGKLLAACLGTPSIKIYQVKHAFTADEGFSLVAQLTENADVVSAMDWSASGLLVTCSHDRNSYVWEQVMAFATRN